jgi:[acyl-carrier-protein] S-malonyltransferase
MTAYLFPGQGAQFPGMGKDLYTNNPQAKLLFETANKHLGFRITDVMFEGTQEDLQQTQVTQPAVFLHSVILAKTAPHFKPAIMAGHSLGELSADMIHNIACRANWDQIQRPKTIQDIIN